MKMTDPPPPPPLSLSTLQVSCDDGGESGELLDAFLTSLGNKLYTTDASDK